MCLIESVFVFVCVAIKWWCTYQRACWVVPRVNRLAVWWRGWLGLCCLRLDGGAADYSALHPAPRAHTAATVVMDAVVFVMSGYLKLWAQTVCNFINDVLYVERVTGQIHLAAISNHGAGGWWRLPTWRPCSCVTHVARTRFRRCVCSLYVFGVQHTVNGSCGTNAVGWFDQCCKRHAIGNCCSWHTLGVE